MKLASAVAVAVGVLFLMQQPAAVALDASAQVKVTPVLKTQTSWDGTPLAYPAGKAEVTGLVVELAPGAQTGWHSHPVPSFALILDGELEIEKKNGERKRLKAGDGVAEVVNTWHNGRNPGTVPLRLVVFYTGIAGEKVSVDEGRQ